MSRTPFFKFYPGDWLAGTSLLSPAEKGGYIDLLCHQWAHGGLPDDIDKLNQLSGLYPGNTPVSARYPSGINPVSIRYPSGINAVSLLQYFPVCDVDGLRRNMKLEEIRNKVVHTSDAQRDRVMKRWNKNYDEVIPGYNSGINPVLPPVIPHQKSEVRSQKLDIRFNITPSFDIENEFECMWERYPNKVGKKEASRHFKATVKNEDDLIKIDQALKNYLQEIQTNKTEIRFIKHGSTWFNNWQDYTERRIENEKRISGLSESDVKNIIGSFSGRSDTKSDNRGN